MRDNTKKSNLPIMPQQYNEMLKIQQELLLLTAHEDDTQVILNRLCTLCEELLLDAKALVMLYDKQKNRLNLKTAPSIEKESWNLFADIVPGPYTGSCGNTLYHGEAQYISNVFNDERGRDVVDKAKLVNLSSCWSVPIKDETHEIVGTFAILSSQEQAPLEFHKKLLEVCSTIATIVLKSEKLAYYDPLTTLKNKNFLQKDIESEGLKTLIFLDVNNFSYINTAYGFKTGDEILYIIAQELQTLLVNETIYRINSDQFALFCKEKKEIPKLVAKIQKHFLDTTISAEDINIKISFNYGGTYSEKNTLKHAALAIKKAKELGKNKLYIYNKEIDSSKNRASFIATNSTIHEAFEDDLIVPYFQGLYDNYENKITKYEVLVRIIKKNGELIPPMDFLEVARLSGLLPKLTQVMIEKSFKFMSTNLHDFSINITEEDLDSQYLLEYLKEKTQEHNIEPYRVSLEILEGISASGKKDNIKQLKELKQYGFKISIDDFGAEYSNFERVLELDVDTIKIDARYIKNIDKDKKSFEIAKAIVSFAQNMQITLVAEFVHSQDVQDIVNKLGIDFSQGFFFSEPSEKIDS